MGLSVTAYVLLAISGFWLFNRRSNRRPRPDWLRPLHYSIGTILVVLVLLLLGIGLVGTIGYYGNLGHSSHLAAGLIVVALVLLSAWSATQINRQSWARSLHLSINAILFFGLAWVSWTGWEVVQKYLP
jgi:thiol:disulfide interchange protein